MVPRPKPAVGLERATSLPNGWRLARFDHMADCVTDRVDNPAEAGVERYVGLEHLDPESLRIRRWGSPTDVEATKLRFKPGDIIFGRRRAYQHKLAVADFEGICSAHAMVLRAREAVALKEFLPLFMQSDLFFDRALAISVGSLSPTINWRTLARQEFPLPPKHEQRRIAGILWAADQAIESWREAVALHDGICSALIDELAGARYGEVPLEEILTNIQYGTSVRSSRNKEDGIPVVGIPNVSKGYLDTKELSRAKLGDRDARRFSLRLGDLLVIRTNGNPEYVGRTVPVSEIPEGSVYASYLIRLQVDESRARPEYVAAVINSPRLRRSLRRVIRSTAGNYNINTKGIKKQRLPLPSLSEQDATVRKLALIADRQQDCMSHLSSLTLLKRRLMDWLLFAAYGS